MEFHGVTSLTGFNMLPVISFVIVEEVPSVDPGLAPIKAGLVLMVSR